MALTEWRIRWTFPLFLLAAWAVYHPALNRVFTADQVWYFAELNGNTSLLEGLRRVTAMMLRAGALVICAVPALQAFWSYARTPRARLVLQLAVLLFVAVDVYRFKFTYLFEHSDVIGEPYRFVVRPSALDYAGNLLFVLPTQTQDVAPGPIPWTLQVPLDSNDSRPLKYEVQQFDSNNVIVSVADAGPQQVWMSYADVWHPFWEATVNGRRTAVYRGELAYKAVLLDPGANSVHFRFRSPAVSTLPALVAGDAALWLFLVCWMIMRGVLQS